MVSRDAGYNSNDSYKSYHSGFSDKQDETEDDKKGPSLNFETSNKPDSSDNIIDEVNQYQNSKKKKA